MGINSIFATTQHIFIRSLALLRSAAIVDSEY